MIPKTFQLLGYTWTVAISSGPLKGDADEKLYGLCDYDTHTIHLAGDLEPVMLWHTFMHEVLHACLAAIGREKLNLDEGFVDGLSGALAQALTPGTKPARPRAARKVPKKRSR